MQITLKWEDYFKLISENIILKDIYVKNKLKNYNLLIKLIKLLALTNKLLSAKEIHKILNYNWIKVSHIIVIKYLDYILKSGLVEKVFRKDLKLWNISTWKAKYLFKSSNIRKAILNNNIKKNIFSENLVYDTLKKIWYNDIFTWKNWTFNFSFITKNIIVHISENTEKKEIKKEINRLNKIEWDYKKYLIINSIKESGLRISSYEPLKIMEIEDFLKEINK